MAYIQRLTETKLVAIMRKVKWEDALSIAKALQKGGMKTIEVTLDSENAYDLIKQMTEEFGEDMLIGAGTVLNAEEAEKVILSGAKFIVAPTLNVETIKVAKRHHVLSIPGCLTPTEILTAYEAGADMVKVFPAGSMGREYIKNILGPLSFIPLMATGGINEHNMCEYLDVGVEAVGLGSSLVPREIREQGDLDRLRRMTEELVRMVE